MGRRLLPIDTLNPVSTPGEQATLLRRAVGWNTPPLGWNVIGVVILAVAAIGAGSVALAGFGLDSLVEIGASTVVLWQLSGTTQPGREHRAMRLIGVVRPVHRLNHNRHHVAGRSPGEPRTLL